MRGREQDTLHREYFGQTCPAREGNMWKGISALFQIFCLAVCFPFVLPFRCLDDKLRDRMGMGGDTTEEISSYLWK